MNDNIITIYSTCMPIHTCAPHKSSFDNNSHEIGLPLWPDLKTAIDP